MQHNRKIYLVPLKPYNPKMEQVKNPRMQWIKLTTLIFLRKTKLNSDKFLFTIVIYNVKVLAHSPPAVFLDVGVLGNFSTF